MIVDAHTHIFPDPIARSLVRGEALVSHAGKIPGLRALPKTFQSAQFGWDLIRSQARGLFRPFQWQAHHLQPMLRHLPGTLRNIVDQIGGLAAVPPLLFESTADDLVGELHENGLDHALIIAHPPLARNEFVLEAAQEHPELLPVVNLPPGTPRPAASLRKFATLGARALKIHAAADGEGADSAHYLTLLRTAADLGLPVILHTGEIHNRLFYKDPKQGRAERFERWFERYPTIPFVLAHMNFHEPEQALEAVETHANVHVDTSWQPVETLIESVRRVGSDRVLFGTDWPLVGDNIAVHLERVRTALREGSLNEEAHARILGQNAARIFKIGAKIDPSPGAEGA